MKRDDLLLRRDSGPSDDAVAVVERRPLYVHEGDTGFFAWYHWSEEAGARDCVALLCAPIGYEYTRAHRTVRHLADKLARHGVPALRFDYHGIGDSPGSDLDPDRLAAWVANIKTAICRARELSGRKQVCLVGIRLGATLAALAAAEIPVDWLVLWNPCVTGRPYLRELRAIALAAERRGDSVEGALESGGFVMSRQTREAIEAIDLTTRRYDVRRVLLLNRDDLAPEQGLAPRLAALGVGCDALRVPGWQAMMAEHQFTVVPEEALATLASWVVVQTDPLAGGALPPSALDRADAIRFEFRDDEGERFMLEERACAFGRDGHLFGVTTRNAATPAGGADAPAPVILINAGTVHHVGPNRIYVAIARHLAAIGHPCLRFDVEGVGDSVRRVPGRENHPYPENAITDVRAAIEYLRWEHGAQRFILMGLCSGAHNAFHAGLAIGEHGVEQLVLINPLTFYWSEGDSIETTLYEDAAAYRKSMRDPGRWLKLARGDVNFARLEEVIAGAIRRRLRSLYDGWCERFAPARAPRLARDLRRLVESGQRIALFVSDGDPGRDILLTGAPYTASRALRAGAITVDMIRGADHTFSQLAPRRDLVRLLVSHLRSRRG